MSYKLIKMGHTADHTSYCLIEYRQKGKRLREWVKREDFITENNIKRLLCRRGADCSDASQIEHFVNRARTVFAESRPLTSTAGWSGSGYNIKPGVQIGKPDAELAVPELVVTRANKTQQTKRAKAWVEDFMPLIAGQPNLLLALGMVLAAPLLELTGEENFAIELVGATSKGKSTVSHFACGASGWARGTGRLLTWNRTDNEAELLMGRHNDRLLVVDEARLLDTTKKQRNLDERQTSLAFRLSSGMIKQRMGDGSGLNELAWRCLVLSNRELKPGDTIVESRQMNGRDARLMALQADIHAHGLFTSLPDGIGSGANLSARLKELSARYNGELFAAWLRKLVAKLNKDDAGLKSQIATLVNEFVEQSASEVRGEIVARIARKFGLLYAALELAKRSKLLPDLEGHQAAISMQMRQALKPFEDSAKLEQDALKNLTAMLNDHSKTCGGKKNVNKRKFRQFDAFRLKPSTKRTEASYVVKVEAWEECCTSKHHAKQLYRDLARKGIAVTKEDRLYPQIDFGQPIGKERMAQFRSSILSKD